MQVYNIKQAKRDIDAVYSMGLFDDVNILPSPAEDTTLESPKVCCVPSTAPWRSLAAPYMPCLDLSA